MINSNQILEGRSSQLNLGKLLEDNRKPGQEIHIIKKPVKTEEFKKI